MLWVWKQKTPTLHKLPPPPLALENPLPKPPKAPPPLVWGCFGVHSAGKTFAGVSFRGRDGEGVSNL